MAVLKHEHVYNIPWLPCGRHAKNKARIAWRQMWMGSKYDVYAMIPSPGSRRLQIVAQTNADAMRIAQKRILPGDDRPIMGRTNIKYFWGDKNVIRVKPKPQAVS